MKKPLKIIILVAIILLSVFYIYTNREVLKKEWGDSQIFEIEKNKNIISNSGIFDGTISFVKTWDSGENLDIKNTIFTKVSLDKDLNGTLEADGYQTFMSYKVVAIPTGTNSVDIIFQSLLDEDSMNLFKTGDYIFSIDFIDNKYLFRDNQSHFNELDTGDVGIFNPSSKEEKIIKENTEDYNNKDTFIIENRYFIGETKGQKFHILYTTVDYNADDAVCIYVKDNIDYTVQKCNMQFSADGWFRIDLDDQKSLIGYGCTFNEGEICKESKGEEAFKIQEVGIFKIKDFLNVETVNDFSNISDGTYYGVKEILKQNGWLPIIPTLYKFSISPATTTPIDTEFPEISYCGSERVVGVICTVDFQKDKVIKHLNVQHTESNAGWLVTGVEYESIESNNILDLSTYSKISDPFITSNKKPYIMGEYSIDNGDYGVEIEITKNKKTVLTVSSSRGGDVLIYNDNSKIQKFEYQVTENLQEGEYVIRVYYLEEKKPLIYEKKIIIK